MLEIKLTINTMNKKITTILISTLMMLVIPTIIYAASAELYFDPTGNDPTGLLGDGGKTNLTDGLALGTTGPTAIALNAINTALSLLGALCLFLLIYGGFIWIWARGNQEEISKAKEILQGTVIGLIIVLAALGITNYVFTTIADISGASVYEAEEPG